MNFPKLKKTCERILALEDNFILKMESYISLQQNKTRRKSILSGEHPCGTSYCIVGILAHLDEYPEQYVVGGRVDFDYHGYIMGELVEDDIGIDSDGWEYVRWLFHAQWPDSLEYAKIRAQYLLDHDFKIPSEFEYTHEFLELAIER